MLGKRKHRIGHCYADAVHVVVTQETVDHQYIPALLGQIHEFYEKALDRLPVEEDPSLVGRLLKAGFCFGPLDPVSNIIANTISSPAEAEAEAGALADETRESISSKIVGGVAQDTSTAARRSLEGLVTFLTVQFRYLTRAGALRYLRLARADLLAAVWPIELDRHRRDKAPTFSFTSSTTWVALRCAAASARHPDPDALVSAAMSLASRQDRVSNLLPRSSSTRLSPAAIARLRRLVRREPKSKGSELANPWLPLFRASQRIGLMKDNTWRPSWEAETGLAPTAAEATTKSVKLLLLDKIHEFYLSALRQLPRHALRSRHHHSLVRGGYCLGRSDPVTNIILNTLWYEAKFPAHLDCVGYEVELICTKLLTRIECRSLYGLVSFLRASVPSLTEHQAVWYLLMGNAEVESAINLARLHNHDINTSREHLAYTEADIEAWHPDPEGMSNFIMSSEFCELSVLVHGLNGYNFEYLAKFLSEKYSCTELKMQQTSKVLSKNQMVFISKVRKKFHADQEFFVRKVDAALKKYANENEESYALHVICGVNPKVTQGPKFGPFRRNAKFEYIHINFLATPLATGGTPALFFAECSGNDEHEETSVCFKFDASICSMAAGRCFHCEHEGVKIVHPYNVSFHGLSEDFHKMSLGKHSMCNKELMSSCELHSEMMCTLREDWILFNPNMDAEIAQMNPIDDCIKAMCSWRTRIC